MSAFIAYDTVDEQIAGAYERVCSALPTHTITRYATTGGGDGVPPWRVLGFYARTSSEARLVCEVFHGEQQSAALVRVYHDSGGAPLFARKWAGDQGAFGDALVQAADVFAASLPADPHPEDPADDLSSLPLSDEERALIARALSPIPPPFSLAATQEA